MIQCGTACAVPFALRIFAWKETKENEAASNYFLKSQRMSDSIKLIRTQVTIGKWKLKLSPL